jgi:hypothetical protein
MRLYLDNSVRNRPFDDQRQGGIWLETLSFSLILSMIENREAEMVVSSVHRLENHVSPDRLRREWVERFLQLATVEVAATEAIRIRARELGAVGVKPLDPLHVSSAEAIRADYFLTRDDRLTKRYQGALRVLSRRSLFQLSDKI